jgi:hypothetical protein
MYFQQSAAPAGCDTYSYMGGDRTIIGGVTLLLRVLPSYKYQCWTSQFPFDFTACDVVFPNLKVTFSGSNIESVQMFRIMCRQHWKYLLKIVFSLLSLFWKNTIDLWDHVAVRMCIPPPLLTFERLNQSLWNLVSISRHLSPSQRRN